MRPRSVPSLSTDSAMTFSSSLSSTTSASTTSSTSTSSSRISSRDGSRCSSCLIPDTTDLIDTSRKNIARLESNRRTSSWDQYLYDTAVEKRTVEEERQRVRQGLLKHMKGYYGNSRWRDVETIEDVELYCNNRKQRPYLDQLVLYGEHGKRRCRYVDRHSTDPTDVAFRRRMINGPTEECEASSIRSLLRKIGALTP